ncbi:hypothetical protein ACVWYQ_003159 [Bradyrhizobium sp. USDA 3397]
MPYRQTASKLSKELGGIATSPRLQHVEPKALLLVAALTLRQMNAFEAMSNVLARSSSTIVCLNHLISGFRRQSFKYGLLVKTFNDDPASAHCIFYDSSACRKLILA